MSLKPSPIKNRGKYVIKKGVIKAKMFLFHASFLLKKIKGIMNNINSYFEHIASEQKKYAIGYFFSNAKYIEHKTNNSPYMIP